MSTHPNAILLLVLTPDDLARKTYRAILTDQREDFNADLHDIEIAGESYHHDVMETNYHEGYQVSAKEGDIIIFDYVTYGYGDVMEWSQFEAQKNDLEAWAKEACEKYHCTYKIYVTANYW